MTVAESTRMDPAASFAEWGFRVSLSSSPGLLPVTALVDLALRRNPKRAHLLVSRVFAGRGGVGRRQPGSRHR
jgi:hypothetical protein